MFPSILALCLALPSAFAQQLIVERNGRIGLRDPQGKVQELTDTGRDFDPWISCNQKTVLFVRSSPEDPFTTSIYEIDLPSKRERLLFDGSIPYTGGQTHYITEPQMGSNRRILYVMAQYGMSTGGVFAVDLATQHTRHITDGAAFMLLQSGKYAGDFLVEERLVSIVGGIYYVDRLYSADGEDLGLAGPRDMDVSSFGCNPPAIEKPQQPAAEAGPTSTPARPQPKAVPVLSGVMAARLEKRVEPDYAVPADAAAADRMVSLVVYISSEGTVTDVELLSGPPDLMPAAMSAVRQWRYKPYEVGGKPVPVVTTVDVQFRKTR